MLDVRGAWRALILAHFLGAIGCAGRLGERGPAEVRVTYAILVNGGGSVTTNYASHTRDLQGMHDVLTERHIPKARIAVLSSDGEDYTPDVVVSAPVTEEYAWLLDGTSLERPLVHPQGLTNKDMPGVARSEATPDELESWIKSAAGDMKPDDNLLLFVTDHGSKGKTPDENSIALWNRQSMTVAQLRRLVAKTPPRSQTVMVMSQCYSGGFAELGFSAVGGQACGYFSSTADRRAYGCYGEPQDAEKDGYAAHMIAGLRGSGSLQKAHASALLADHTPDVPLRTSDLFLQRFVDSVAARRGVTSDELLEAAVKGGLTGDEAALVEAVATTFALPVPGRAATWHELQARLRALESSAKSSQERWRAAFGDVAEGNLRSFLARNANWAARTRDLSLWSTTLDTVVLTRGRLLDALAEQTRATAEPWRLMNAGHEKVAAANDLLERARTRTAALLRLRVLITSVLGARLVATEGAAADRAKLAALVACESFTLPGPVLPAKPPVVSAYLPPLEDDEALVRTLTPAVLGASFAALTPPERQAAPLPEGAVKVVVVEPGSPAQAAGLRSGDLLLGHGGAPTREPGAMKLRLSLAEPGATTLDIVRGKEPLSLPVSFVRPSQVSGDKSLPAFAVAALRSLTAYRGSLAEMLEPGKPCVLFFWATWCGVCKKALPGLLELERSGRAKVVAITQEDPQVVADFFGGLFTPRFPHRVALDRTLEAALAFEVEAFPIFVWLDRHGQLEGRLRGYSSGMPLDAPPPTDE